MYSEKIDELIGKTMTKVVENGDELTFYCESGEKYRFYHYQDCCEHVVIEDICGDLNDLVGSKTLNAEEVYNERLVAQWDEGRSFNESHTWTFYKFATLKGYVDVRWLGESNGYYSESVSFCKL